MQSSSPQGLVLRIDAKVCHVEVDGERRQLPLAGKLFDGKRHEKRPLAVGDRVQLDATGQAIDAVLPRSSQLHRRAASEGEAEAQVLAANITHVLAVASVAEPPFQPELVDGILAAALRERIPATLVLSKIDLDHALAAQWAQVYAHAMVRVLATCTVPGHTTQPTLDELARLLHQNNSVVVGLSGAGKSTLLNAVVPGVTLRTGDLNHIRQGRHTTTHTELLPLLTTQAGSLLAASREVLRGRLRHLVDERDSADLDTAIDAVVRLVLSNVMQPSGSPAATADEIAWVAGRLL